MSLYTKYRPQTFSDVVDQQHIVATLQKQYEKGQLAHAYLFCGPRGVGKTTTARIVAKLANCTQVQNNEPCNICSDCLAVSGNASLKIVEIDAASNRGINEIRELKERVRMSGYTHGALVFIIDEVHMLTPEAFNALLKTLEEPPKNVIFILATTEVQKLPDTIVSRCQRFDFHKVTFLKMKELLKKIADAEHIQINENVLERIARHADGYVRDSIVLLEQCIALSGGEKISMDSIAPILPHKYYEEALSLFVCLAEKNVSKSLTLIQDWFLHGVHIETLHRDILEYLRMVHLVQNGILENTVLYHPEKSQEVLLALQKDWSIYKLLSVFLSHLNDYGHTPIETLPLELSVLELFENSQKNVQSPNVSDSNHPIKLASNTIESTHSIQKNIEEKSILTQDLNQSTNSKISQTEKIDVQVLNESSVLNIARKWQHFVAHLKQKSPSMALCASGLHVDGISSEGHLSLITTIKMYYEKLHDPLYRKSFEVACEEFFGEPLFLSIQHVPEIGELKYKKVLDEEQKEKSGKDSIYIQHVAKELGIAS